MPVTLATPQTTEAAPYRPWVGRKFGVEMEMRQQRTNDNALNAAHLDTAIRGVAQIPLSQRGAGYYHSSGETWDVKTDSSCGWEVASPAMTMNERGECEELQRVTNALANLHPRIDRSCGLHVHVDLSDFVWEDMQRLISLWARYEPFFFQLTPPSRWTNQYCRPVCRARWSQQPNSVWGQTSQAINAPDERAFNMYARNLGRLALNMSHWFTAARVEFRLGAGTVDYEKIRNWVLVLLALVQRVKRTDMPEIGRFQTIRTTPMPTAFVARVLGLAPSQHVPAVPETNERLIAWCEARRVQFTARASAA
jgi:hypothetical protein